MLRTTCVIVLIVAMSSFSNSADVNSHKKVVVCYVGSWAQWRPDSGSFTVDDMLDSVPMLCTHVIYSFAGLEPSDFSMKSLDAYLDYEKDGGNYKKLMRLKERNPRLKILIAIGGWNEGSAKYSNMSKNPHSRQMFIKSATNFLRENKFDGLDLDWEYPGSREGSHPEDKQNFVALVKELREEFTKAGNQWLLTAALGASPETIRKGYDLASLSKYLSFFHIMAYDYHGSWDARINHNAPLHRSTLHNEPDDGLNLANTVAVYTKHVPRDKLVLGVPFYGRTFVLENPVENRLGSPASKQGFKGPFTKEDGFMGYNEICREISSNLWTQGWDTEAQVPFLHQDDRWISYDNADSIKAKVRYAFKQKLAGIMIWSIDTDDFKADCSPVKYPLLRAINQAFVEAEQDEMNEIPSEKPTLATTTGKPNSATSFLPLSWMIFAPAIAFMTTFFRV